MLRRSWVEIDLNQIKKNYQIYKAQLPENTKVMAVVKADAYGHGDIKIAECMQQCGVELFAVSNIEEAIRLRLNNIKGEILILGYTPISCITDLMKYDITQALLSSEYFEEVLNSNLDITHLKCQYAIDTGMNRIGLDADDLLNTEQSIRFVAKKLNLTGLFTHLYVADTDNEQCIAFTKEQIKKFEIVADSVADLKLKYIHCLNSAGGLSYNNCKYNSIVRLGIILYGLKPDYSNVLPDGIHSALSWKSVISMIKDVHKGETIGYGRTFVAEQDMKVATVPTGYADGYNRLLSNKGHVIINGKNAPILGRICMDQFMIDVSNIEDLKIGDEIDLLNTNYNADDMAQELNTIGYEIICDIGRRVSRLYK